MRIETFSEQEFETEVEDLKCDCAEYPVIVSTECPVHGQDAKREVAKSPHQDCYYWLYPTS